MEVKLKKHYLSIKTKNFWWIIGNVYGNGFTITNMNRCKKYQ